MKLFKGPAVLAAVVAVAVSCATASAWSYKEHVLLTREAAHRILEDESAPEGLKAFLRDKCPEAVDFDLEEFVLHERFGPNPEGITGLSFWATHPDVERSTPVPTFASDEGKMHYLDVEFLNPDPSKRHYLADGSGLPELADFPRDVEDERYQEAGYLPFRIEQCYGELVKAWREGDAESAEIWGGYLAHYLGDNTQPQHATIDYKSATYFDRASVPGGRPNVHGWVEYGFIDDAEPSQYPRLRQELADAMEAELAEAQAVPLGDPFVSSLETSRRFYGYLPLIGEAALATHEHGGDLNVFAGYRLEDEGPTLMQAKALALSQGTLRIEGALRQAWSEAHGEFEPAEGDRTPGLLSRPTARPSVAGVE